MLTAWQIVAVGVGLLFLWLWNINRVISTLPEAARKLVQKDWTKKEIEDAYEHAQTSPTDVKPFLFTRQNRRYVVVGGSGLVGGWIVQHLLMRGEDPRAVRIIDLAPVQRKDAIDANIDCIITDVSNPEAVSSAFRKEWPDAVKAWPLTVFHTVAYINASQRAADFLSPYVKVNISGTKSVLNAAKAAGASCFIATSSGGIALAPVSFFRLPWPNNILQVRPNADREVLDGPLESFGSCYAWSKAQAQKIVEDANDPRNGFYTGIIRPAHGIYGHGAANSSSLSWDYLRRGGTPSWIQGCMAPFVSAQNVSVGHLAYENALLEGRHEGGKGYCVTDPNPPLKYGNLYDVLEQKAHPSTPVKFDRIPPVLILIFSHMLEAYVLFRHRYAPFIPEITGDMLYCQPAIFNMCTLHLSVTDTAAQQEIGYRAPHDTLEGLALAVLDWNENINESIKSYKKTAVTGSEVLAT